MEDSNSVHLIQNEHLDEIIEEFQNTLPFTLSMLGVCINVRNRTMNRFVGRFVRDKVSHSIEAVLLTLGTMNYLWGKNLTSVSLLFNHIDYSKPQIIKFSPKEYLPLIKLPIIRGPLTFKAFRTTYDQFRAMNVTWKQLTFPILSDLENGKAIIGPIRDSYIPLVESRKAFPSPYSTYLRDCIRNYPSACIEIKDPDTGVFNPAAWVLRHCDGSLGVLHTEEAYRRKDLARVLVIHYVRQLFQSEETQRYGLVLSVAEDNLASLNLFGNLGFESTHNFLRILTQPIAQSKV